MDFPHFFLWREILDAFPGAKVIFWERDIDSWYQSFLNQFLMNHEKFNNGLPEWLLDLIGGILFPKSYGTMTAGREAFMGLMFSSPYTPRTKRI